MNAPFKSLRSAKKKREYLEHLLVRRLDAAVALIDETDGDWDLEPSLGSAGTLAGSCDQRRWTLWAGYSMWRSHSVSRPSAEPL